jgi:hypothetical protein
LLQPNPLDSAKVIDLIIMGIGSSTLCGWCKQGAGKFLTVTTQFHPFFFDAVQSSTSLFWKMKMLTILHPTALAGDFLQSNAKFVMDDLSEFVGYIFCIEFAVKTIQATGRC